MGCSSVVGTLLFFLITFRSNQSYSRWWEGRCLWGKQIYASKNLCQMAATWLTDCTPAVRLEARTSRL